jgi:hypothetical protein
MRRILLMALLAAASGAAGSAAAQSDEDWEVKVTPYIWLAWPQGDIQAKSRGGGGGTALDPDINVNFDDVKLSGVFTGSADVRHQNYGLFGDFTYYSIEADKDIAIRDNPPFLNGKFEVSGAKAMIAGYWRAYQTPNSSVDLLAGAHYLKGEVDLNVATANRSFSRSAEDSWWDPIVGIRGGYDWGRFGVEGFATYGGFGVSSDTLYDLYGAGRYRFTETFTASVGYRYFKDEFSGDRLDYDVSFSGPLMGLTFAF